VIEVGKATTREPGGGDSIPRRAMLVGLCAGSLNLSALLALGECAVSLEAGSCTVVVAHRDQLAPQRVARSNPGFDRSNVAAPHTPGFRNWTHAVCARFAGTPAGTVRFLPGSEETPDSARIRNAQGVNESREDGESACEGSDEEQTKRVPLVLHGDDRHATVGMVTSSALLHSRKFWRQTPYFSHVSAIFTYLLCRAVHVAPAPPFYSLQA
jgi:hypothetical protein